jgi:predicted Abi (CAAX) family protease
VPLQLFIALSIGESLPNRLVAPLYGTLCISWPLDEVCAAALSFIFYGEMQARVLYCRGLKVRGER